MIRVRELMLGFAVVYAAAALCALAFSGDLPLVAFSAVAFAASYAMSRTLPDTEIESQRLVLHVLIALGLIAFILWKLASPSSDNLAFVAIAAAFCAGNRTRAAGIGPSSRRG